MFWRPRGGVNINRSGKGYKGGKTFFRRKDTQMVVSFDHFVHSVMLSFFLVLLNLGKNFGSGGED